MEVMVLPFNKKAFLRTLLEFMHGCKIAIVRASGARDPDNEVRDPDTVRQTMLIVSNRA